MTTVDTLDSTRNPIRAYRHGDDHVNASPFDMGAGHINPNKAFDSGVPPEAEAHGDQSETRPDQPVACLVGWGLEIMEDDEGRWVMSGAAEAKAAEIRVFQVMKTMEDTYAGN
ncbi:unnamed protein product [Prunus armeniaca]|uniref:Uncharacterized protein n=1 Tax=Prunus armeniaca TaxID=36596 RepID=A0A6J5TGD3_PRUAR|nr:unnamed protein product [Prunus armeniaca]